MSKKKNYSQYIIDYSLICILPIEAAHYDVMAAATPQIVLQQYRHLGAMRNLPEEEEEYSAVVDATLHALIGEGYIIEIF